VLGLGQEGLIEVLEFWLSSRSRRRMINAATGVGVKGVQL